MQVVPEALLLHFAAAELHEAGGDTAAAKEVYERLAAPLDGDREAGAPATPDAKDGAAAAAAQVLNLCATVCCTPAFEHWTVRVAHGASLQHVPIPCWKHLINLIFRWLQGQRDSGQQEAGSLVWVQYQRFAKRTEGVRASRQVCGHDDLNSSLSRSSHLHVHQWCSGGVFLAMHCHDHRLWCAHHGFSGADVATRFPASWLA
jgi:hypothetical protein